MWLQQLIQSIKARRELALWLKQQRAGQLDIPHLSAHMRQDLGLDNPRAETTLYWQPAPAPTQEVAPADASDKTRSVGLK